MTTSGKQLFTTLAPDGTLTVEVGTSEFPAPTGNQVLVRMEAAPINPSDLALLFGAADLEIKGRTPVPLGSQLSGLLRLERPVSPTADWTVKLTCFDIYETNDTRDSATSPFRRDAYPVWSETIKMPAETDISQGLPFQIRLPASVGPKPVKPLERKNAYFSYTASVNIPGFKRVVSHNAPPVARHWTLLITTPTSGPEFRVEFPVPIVD